MRTILATILCVAALFAAGENSNRRAPGWALPDSKMNIHDLADYRGKVVILEFMQTTCPHCAAFAPILNEVLQKYGDRVVVVAIANSQRDNQGTVAQYISGHQVKYPILFDAGQMAYSYFRSQSFDNPHVFLIDGAGTIKNDFGYSPMTAEIFEGKAIFPEIDKLLSGGGVPAKNAAPTKKK
jgi:thiol-disulfide isomerase/thioredoxin